MSGERQHFIPQFLQKGFASHMSGDEAFTWVYRKGGLPFNAKLDKVGVERSFYTTANDTLADDLITEAERPFSKLVQTLRTSPQGAISDPQLPILIAHLEVRTRHLRQSYMQSAESIVSQFIDFMADEDSFADFFERKLRNNPSMIQTMFSEEPAKMGLPPSMLGPLMEAVPLHGPVFRAWLKSALPEFAAQLRSDLPRMMSEAAKSGHIKALKKGIAPDVKAQRYKDLLYSTADLRNTSLILGDSPILFQVDASKPYKTFLEEDDLLTAVFLPLAPQRLLIGAHSRSIARASDLRGAIARCSLEYFIAHDNCEANDLLKEHIGEDASLRSKSEIEEILAEVLNQ
jgi:hypothetical protein